ncbi:hypothetical protein SYNGFB01_04070 [Synechococcus sp. GFB01]|nr:hypothetical protein [Synechococcus sp. GFB01]KMM17445.1 hypothetical protein SYNGFB01_04070 [Synechococcus sp. GFB01]
MTGLYDGEGVLRFYGRDRDDCLAYAELFGLDPSRYSLFSLFGEPEWVAGDGFSAAAPEIAGLGRPRSS